VSPGRHRRAPYSQPQHAAPTAAQAMAQGAAVKAAPAALAAGALLAPQSPAMAVFTPVAAPAVWSQQVPAQPGGQITAQLASFAPPPVTDPVTPALDEPYAEQVVQDWRIYATPLPPHIPADRITTDALVVHHEAAPGSRHYTVQPGDTLSAIALKTLGSAAAWHRIWDANRAVIANPSLIMAGEVLAIPGDATPALVPAALAATAARTMTALSGTLSCAGLEALWDQAGGAPDEAFMAAEIAQAESGGNQFATGGVGERGYWQINPNHGALSTYASLGNAGAAIELSHDGTDWDAWTTFLAGAYQGRC